MYPYGGLPENLAAFCRSLRDEHGFRLGSRELQDAVRALSVVRLGDERAVRNALRPVLCSTLEQVALFDAAFDAFFYLARGIAHQNRQVPTPARLDGHETGDRDADRSGARGESREGDADSSAAESLGEGPVVFVVHDEDAESAPGFVRSNYSPLEGEGVAPGLAPIDESWRAAALAFVSVLRGGLSRRWRPARHGERFDLRRTLRYSLHTGGEAIIPRWQARPRHVPRFVLLVDGSRSMSGQAQTALNMAVAIASVTPNIEAFAFSTTLQRLTRDVRRAAAGERRHLDYLRHAWGGGTNIGGCLQMFLQRFADGLLGRETVFIIASDGLDVGAPDVLRRAMGRLYRESAGVIWLNPLLETAGYEPTAIGMTAARRYVSTFACVNSPAGLLHLARTVRVKR